MNYNNWKILFDKDFWNKKEISYQYVHFTNSAAIVIILLMLTGTTMFQYIAMLSGFIAGILVEAKQWIGGNHKVEDMIRDLFFWGIGDIAGYIIYYN